MYVRCNVTAVKLILYGDSDKKFLLMTLRCSYRFLVFSAHVIVRVTLFFYKVIRGRKPVFVKQLTAVLALHLVGLTSAFLNKAEPMTVERFVHSEVLEAVSHQCTVWQSCIGGSPFCLFTSRLTDCFRCL